MSAEREPRPLEVALQALGIATLMLPIAGVVIRAVEYATVPAIPTSIIFSESVGSLSFGGLLTLAIPGLLLLLVWSRPMDTPVRPSTRERIETAILLVVAASLATLGLPFPAGPGVFLPALALLFWYGRRRLAGQQPNLSEVVLWLVISLLVTVPAIALVPTSQTVYVVSAEPSAIPTGWYIQLGDSHDPTYLLSCSGSRVIGAPLSSIVSLTYNNDNQPDSSLLHILQTGRINLGIQTLCPTAPPPP